VFLSYAAVRFRWGSMSASAPSRFISEIDPCFLEFVGGKTTGSFMPKQNKPVFNFGERTSSGQNTRRQEVIPGKFTSNSAADSEKIKPGMTVEHLRFGIGKVLAIDDSGDNAKATIHFGNAGQKQLLLKFAKLKIVR